MIWYEFNEGRWVADNYGEAYEKACEVTDLVYWGDRDSNNNMHNLQRVKRPQAPSLSIKSGKLRKKEKPDV